MMRHLASAACGLWIALAGPLAAQSNPAVVVELYTSQGCSSCPPADAYFATLLGNPGVIPLSLHVDYWDYIGWEDSFGNPKFSDRQRAYARAEGHRTIYTPQFIVGGVGRIVGVEPEEMAAQLRQHLQSSSGVSVWLERKGDTVTIRAEARPPLTETVRVQLVRYIPKETVAIERGENAGHSVTYHNIVTSWTVLGDWTGKEPLTLEAAAAGSQPMVVIIQEPAPGRILAASAID